MRGIVILLAGLVCAGAADPAAERVRKANAALDEVLASQDTSDRGEALAALGVAGRADALARLTEALKAEQGELRFAGARGLRYLKDERAAPAIAKAFREEKGWRVREELAYAAGACKAGTLVEDLKAALKDPNARVSLAAMFALNDLGDPAGAALAKAAEREGVPKAGTDKWSRKVLSGKKDGDKALAARTLALIGTAEDLPLLEEHLGDRQPALRVWAAAAILRLSAR